MGIRTPGEKTAHEVQALENAAGRIFQEKVNNFELNLLEPILNSMLEIARRNMDTNDIVRVLDDDLGVARFMAVTKEDITAKGTFQAMGSRYFKERSRRMQNLNTILSIKGSMPDVGVHMSGKTIAKILAEELDEADLFTENVQIEESKETQTALQNAQVDFQEDQEILAEDGA
jgi:hypothetical protein